MVANRQITNSQAFHSHCFLCAPSHPYSWSLAMDTSTHSLFSLLSSLSMFLNVIMMTSNVVRAEDTGLAAAIVLQAPQWDRQACTPTRCDFTDKQPFILGLTLSWLSLFLLPHSRSLHSQHTTGWISIVMCLVASHWLESITAGHPVSTAEDVYTGLLFVNHVQQQFIFMPLQSAFQIKKNRAELHKNHQTPLRLKYICDMEIHLTCCYIRIMTHIAFNLFSYAQIKNFYETYTRFSGFASLPSFMVFGWWVQYLHNHSSAALK